MIDLKITSPHVTLVDRVEDKMLNYFKTNNLKPGDPIPNEKKLAEALGIGRSVLREALSRLRMLGLIETRSRRGMILTEPSLLGGMKHVVDPGILSNEALFDLLGFRVALEIGIKEKFSEYFLPKNLEIEKTGKTVTHKDLLDLLRKRDKDGFLKAMIDHFSPYFSFLKKKNQMNMVKTDLANLINYR